jgi:hypothetical protein
MKRPGDGNRKSLSASDFYPNGFEATRFRRGEADGETMRTELKTALKSLPLTRGAGTAALPYRTAWVHADLQAGSRGEASGAAVVRGKGDGIPAEDPEVLARPVRKWSALARHGWEEQRLGQGEKEQVAKFEEHLAKREQQWLGKFEDQRMARLEKELPTHQQELASQINQQRLASLGRKQTAGQEERRPQASQDGQPQKQLANQVRQQLTNQQRQQLDNQQRQQLDNQQQLLPQLASQDEQQQELANQDEQQQELANQDEQQQELATLEERRLAKLDAGVRKEMQLLQGRAQVTILFIFD